MPVNNRIAHFAEEVAEWRRDFHAHPELNYDVHRTAGVVADRLRSFGCDEVVTGIGRTGVVGVIKGRSPGNRAIGLRADMDALPILEGVSRPYSSVTAGLMHACGHDGHTAMLLGAAKYLAETRNFSGSAIIIFQPAEEGGGGGKAMIEDGLMQRFDISEVYGMHNKPGLPIGEFGVRPDIVEDGGLDSAETEIIRIAFDFHRAKIRRIFFAEFFPRSCHSSGDLVDDRAPGITEREEPGHFVIRFAGRVVARAA